MALINTADKLYLGAQTVGAVYLGPHKVWPSVAFSPADLPGLSAWYAGDKLTGYADGATITAWPDFSGLNQVGTLLGTPGPFFVANGRNGKPIIRFARNGGRARVSVPGIDVDYTAVMVGRSIDLAPPASGRIVSSVSLIWGWFAAFEDIAYSASFLLPDVRKAATNSWIMYSADSQGGDGIAGYRPRLLRDGVFLSGNSIKTRGWEQAIYFSGSHATANSNTMDCEIAEFCLYAPRLADADRQKVEAYMRGKYAL
jgi:hypothetical protein